MGGLDKADTSGRTLAKGALICKVDCLKGLFKQINAIMQLRCSESTMTELPLEVLLAIAPLGTSSDMI